MRESRTYGSVRGARDETRVPTATKAGAHHPARRALPDVVARTATLVADKDNSYKMREAFPEAMITLPGKSYPDSDLTAACAGLILAPPKTAELKQ